MGKLLPLAGAAAALAFIVSAATPASADITYSSFSDLGSQAITINYVGNTGPGNATSLTADAGEFALNDVKNNGTPLGTLYTFCFDIFDYLQSPGSFTGTSLVTGPTGQTLDALLYNGEQLIAAGTDTNATAGLQLAIWEMEYANTGVTFDASPDVTADATTFQNDVINGTWNVAQNTAVEELTGSGNQSQIALVPEPASLAVLGIGMAGLAARRRKRAGRAVA
jgi:hypothetical protein